jgi:hypothetical protein
METTLSRKFVSASSDDSRLESGNGATAPSKYRYDILNITNEHLDGTVRYNF